MTEPLDFETLAGADSKTWTRARLLAAFSPDVAATVKEVQHAYAELAEQAADLPDTPMPDVESRDWFRSHIRAQLDQ